MTKMKVMKKKIILWHNHFPFTTCAKKVRLLPVKEKKPQLSALVICHWKQIKSETLLPTMTCFPSIMGLWVSLRLFFWTGWSLCVSDVLGEFQEQRMNSARRRWGSSQTDAAALAPSKHTRCATPPIGARFSIRLLCGTTRIVIRLVTRIR